MPGYPGGQKPEHSTECGPDGQFCDQSGNLLPTIIFTGEMSPENEQAVRDTVLNEIILLGGTEAWRKAMGLGPGELLEFNWNPNCYYCRPKICHENVSGGKVGGEWTSREFWDNGVNIEVIECDENNKCKRVVKTCNCKPVEGVTSTEENLIMFASISPDPNEKIYNVHHELGHQYDKANGRPSGQLGDLATHEKGIIHSQNHEISPSEIWANMWLDWMIDEWNFAYFYDEATARMEWMNNYMSTNLLAP